jgi:hypothetical protein
LHMRTPSKKSKIGPLPLPMEGSINCLGCRAPFRSQLPPLRLLCPACIVAESQSAQSKGTASKTAYSLTVH